MKKISIWLRSVALFLCMMTFGISQAGDNNYQSPEQVEGAITASLAMAKMEFDKGSVFVDVRNPRLYKKKHIPGAYHLDLKDGFDEAALAAIVTKEQPVVIYCSGIKCSRSYRACEQAVSWGYTQVYYFRGGSVEWRDAGYPVTIGTDR